VVPADRTGLSALSRITSMVGGHAWQTLSDALAAFVSPAADQPSASHPRVPRTPCLKCVSEMPSAITRARKAVDLEHRRRDQDEHRWIVIWRFDDQAHLRTCRCHCVAVSRSDEQCVVGDTLHTSVRDASVDGTTHCCQSGGTHEPRSTSPVRSSPRRLGLGDAIRSADAIRRDCATWASRGEWVGDEDR
jgi:hypothetical protein